MTSRSIVVLLTFVSSIALVGGAQAQVGPDGIDWVTIGAVGNAPWSGVGAPRDSAIGRGSVGYEYKIGRFEVTTSQWAEFYNAAYDRPRADWLPFLSTPRFWGAVGATPNTPGGRRWTVPAGNEMRFVGGISWRTAAIYCNWLCNNKSTDRSAFLNGAYDVGTFGVRGTPPTVFFTDQATHNPGAQYWIPTWDEWLKAAHYDQNKANSDGTRGGWWRYSNASDTPYVYGLPGDGGEANAGTAGLPGDEPFTTPLGAYANVRTPWGLLDAAGGTSEWTEEVRSTFGSNYRLLGGSGWNSEVNIPEANPDWIGEDPGDFPSLPLIDYGFRIASTVPSPPTLGLIASGGLYFSFRTRRAK